MLSIMGKKSLDSPCNHAVSSIILFLIILVSFHKLFSSFVMQRSQNPSFSFSPKNRESADADSIHHSPTQEKSHILVRILKQKYE